MIGACCAATRMVNIKLQNEARSELSFLNNAFMNDEVAKLLYSIFNAKAHTFATDEPNIANLSA